MYDSLETAVRKAEELNVPLWKSFQLNDCTEEDISETESFSRMLEMYHAMKQSDQDYNPSQRSASGLVGTEAEKLRMYHSSGKMIVGDFIESVMEKALKVAAGNACMKRIVAAPTAGACGVIPAVFITAEEQLGIKEEKIVEALYTAAGIGGVIALRASLSGAAGGCQAEIGSASAMAAGGLAWLLDGDSTAICDASALALKGMLGLACDPVAGLVEVPCVKRNVIGAVNAVTSAEMALAGIHSRIPADQVFDAMGSIGRHLPEEIRETARGGLATTPEGKKIAEKMHM